MNPKWKRFHFKIIPLGSLYNYQVVLIKMAVSMDDKTELKSGNFIPTQNFKSL